MVETPRDDRAPTPFVSVIVPVLNERRYLPACLNALLAQDYPAELLEILVIDGGSRDGSREIVRDVARSHARVVLLENAAGTIPSGLNIGICASRGSIISRVDAHALVASDYVSECVRALNTTSAVNVGGPMRKCGLGFWGRVIARAMSSWFAGPARFHRVDQPEYVDTVYLGTFRRATFDRVGLFDEAMLRNEDYELNYRIRRAGGRIYCTPSIRVDYFCRESLPALLAQYWNYGRAKTLVLTRHPGSLRPRHLAAPLLVKALAIGASLALLGRPLALLGSLLVYGTASAFFSIRAAQGAQWSVAGAAAVAFACMHLAWGTGFLVGMARGLASLALSRKQQLKAPA